LHLAPQFQDLVLQSDAFPAFHLREGWRRRCQQGEYNDQVSHT
jgi:hypothetical protein